MRRKLILLMIAVMLPSLVLAEGIRFQPGDTVDVTVLNSPEMSGSFRIHPDGFIRIPLAGKIPAAGKNEEELYQAILGAVSTFVINPHITIIPKFAVSVIGCVTEPGVFTVTGAEKVIELIAQAGGFSADASGTVVLHRKGKAFRIAKDSILTGGPALTALEPGDILVAERKRFTRSDYSFFISTATAISVCVYYVRTR